MNSIPPQDELPASVLEARLKILNEMLPWIDRGPELIKLLRANEHEAGAIADLTDEDEAMSSNAAQALIRLPLFAFVGENKAELWAEHEELELLFTERDELRFLLRSDEES
jgi:DNA gyrase/topoisomerase IV subunit A